MNKAMDAFINPCFPAYISGHATFGGAWAETLTRYFRTDAITFTGTTDDPKLPPGSTSTYTSLKAAADEEAISRVYVGVHYRFDGQFGVSSGKSVADYTFDTQLQPLP